MVTIIIKCLTWNNPVLKKRNEIKKAAFDIKEQGKKKTACLKYTWIKAIYFYANFGHRKNESRTTKDDNIFSVNL